MFMASRFKQPLDLTVIKKFENQFRFNSIFAKQNRNEGTKPQNVAI